MTDSVKPASLLQFQATAAGLLPAPERVAEGVWAIASPIPEGQITHTLTYVLRESDDRIHLIDPGWNSDENLAQLERSLDGLGFSLDSVASTVSTHYHPDHLGIADRLRNLVDAEVVLSRVDKQVLDRELNQSEARRADYQHTLMTWGVPPDRHNEMSSSFDRPMLGGAVSPNRELDEGDTLDLGGHVLRIIGTPGHTSGHLCLVDNNKRLIYTGDHVLPGIYSGVGLGSLPDTEPLADYFDSLERLAPFDEFQALPGHEFRFRGLRGRRNDIAAHHLRRTREVRRLFEELGDSAIWEYAQRMTWTGGWESLNKFLMHSALQQTQMHLGLVTSGRADSLFHTYRQFDEV